jgi:hypothetical protein
MSVEYLVVMVGAKYWPRRPEGANVIYSERNFDT